jgi:hypothetical protein
LLAVVRPPPLGVKIFVFTKAHPDNEVQLVKISHTLETPVRPRSPKTLSEGQEGKRKLFLGIRIANDFTTHPKPERTERLPRSPRVQFTILHLALDAELPAVSEAATSQTMQTERGG